MANNNVNIPDNAFETMAVLAALEVPGVYSVDGSITKEKAESVSKGVSSNTKVEIDNEDKTLKVYLTIEIDFGYTIPDVSKAVMEKVAMQIQNMTDYKVTAVNILVDSVHTKNRD